MRRTFFFSLGLLELLVAGVLAFFAWQLPSSAEVDAHMGRVHKVGVDTQRQLASLRQQVHLLRERRPQVHELAVRLQQEMKNVSDALRSQQVDYPTVQAISNALGDAARGLDGLSQTLDPEAVARVGMGLKAMADYLEEQVTPAAAQMAREVESAAGSLKADAEGLAALLRTAPVDLKAAREVHNSLGRFGEGLDRLEAMLKVQRAEAMRDGFKGMEESLATGAEQVERLAGYTYPSVRFEGLKPVIDQKQFWPEGDKIAEGMRKAARGTTAAGEQLEQLTRDLPKIREALQESRKVTEATRTALGGALGQQAKVEALLKNVPEHAARLAEGLPRLSGALSRVLRDTARLKDVAGLLRHTQKGVENAVSRWPELRKDLVRSADLLRLTQTQVRYVLDHKAEYEASGQRALGMSRTLSAALPLLTDQLDLDLLEQEHSLSNLGDSVHEFSETMPGVARTATGLVQTTRLLLLLVAGVFALHGLHLALTERSRKSSQ